MGKDTDAEILTLRFVLRDLVAFSAVPAAWAGREPAAVAAGLADALTGLLQLDFVFVRLCVPSVAGAVDVTRGKAWKAFPEWLENHLAALGEVNFQPFRKCLPCLSPRDVDFASDTGNAQANENEIKLQQVDQRVGKTGSHGSRFSTDPRRRDGGKRHEIPEHRSQRADFSIGIAEHSACRACALAERTSLPDLE